MVSNVGKLPPVGAPGINMSLLPSGILLVQLPLLFQIGLLPTQIFNSTQLTDTLPLSQSHSSLPGGGATLSMALDIVITTLTALLATTTLPTVAVAVTPLPL